VPLACANIGSRRNRLAKSTVNTALEFHIEVWRRWKEEAKKWVRDSWRFALFAHIT
jgi:hypothetical protein